MKMRPGGRDIEQVSSHPRHPGIRAQPAGAAPPHARGQRHDDRLRRAEPRGIFRATNVKTTTDPNAEELQPQSAVAVTASRELSARFDPQSSQLTAMEQTGDFTYQAGDRKARAGKATFDNKQNVMTLDTGAMRLRRHRGHHRRPHPPGRGAPDDFIAEGNVNSSRLPGQEPEERLRPCSPAIRR